MKNTAVQIRKLTEQEIRLQIKKLRQQLLTEKISTQEGHVKDTNRARKSRKELARLQTVLTEQEFLNNVSKVKKEGVKKQ